MRVVEVNFTQYFFFNDWVNNYYNDFYQKFLLFIFSSSLFCNFGGIELLKNFFFISKCRRIPNC